MGRFLVKWTEMSEKVYVFLWILSCWTIQTSLGQVQFRQFPPLHNAALDRPISTTPASSTCGVPTRSAYCESTASSDSVSQCVQAYCVQTCPGRTRTPTYLDLLLAVSPGFGSCVVTDTVNTRPNSVSGEFATVITGGGSTCYLTPTYHPNLGTDGALTVAAWVWMDTGDMGSLFQKVSENNRVVVEVHVGTSGVALVYLQSALSLTQASLNQTLPKESWIHVALQVYRTTVSFFINGLGVGYSARSTMPLASQIQDQPGRFRVGQNHDGTRQYIGKIQDLRFYSETLTNREIQEIYTGTLLTLRIQSECRCPPTHPRIKPQQTHHCIPNGVADNAGQEQLRINAEARPLEYANDGDSNSIWVSTLNSGPVDITIDLGDQFQVFFVVIQFYSPLPRAVVFERQKSATDPWERWQLYASDCTSYFNQPNNGDLASPTAVNCVQLGWNGAPIPYTKGNITFNLLSPEPIARPGFNNFYNTRELIEFVKASKVRVRLQDHYYVSNIRHMYYGIYDFIITARCNCHGHADACNTSSLPYKCSCSADSFTEGNRCELCQPLYNDKPFRIGDRVEPYNCRPCQCYGHASSCVYNASIDPFPNDHTRGGGGVCLNCRDNTEGAQCQSCTFMYYRPQGNSLYAPDVCQPCNCSVMGVANGNMVCDKVGGQCTCRVNAGGRQCDACRDGYYNLTSGNPDGCQPCSCFIEGAVNGSTACHLTTGQCGCKKNVIERSCDSCNYGYYNLSASNPEGCTACNCNPLGSKSLFCDRSDGHCVCKEGVTGLKCDQCLDGFYNFSAGCLPCNCNTKGSQANTECDKINGQCVCKRNVQGRMCDTCTDRTYGFGSSTADGCLTCDCDPAGTVDGQSECNTTTGACLCKPFVTGLRCHLCMGNTYGLDITDPNGCRPCSCDPSGTQFGDVRNSTDLACDQTTGQCTCLVNRINNRCSDCKPGYYVVNKPGGGCTECSCNVRGTLASTFCDTQTGQCQCKGGDSGVTGLSCNQCRPTFYNFVAFTGTCSACGCFPAGSLNNTCQSTTGQCPCKQFVTGRTCDQCATGASNLEAGNPFGCSKVPSQQPPPTHVPISATQLLLLWNRPDYPNGVVTEYRLYRNGSRVATVNASGPLQYNDTGLTPFTSYTYEVEVVNAHGTARSAQVTFRTKEGTPTTDSKLNVTDVRPKSARFTWTAPSLMNGPLANYSLVSRTPGQTTEDYIHWTGTLQEVTLTSLVPFTNYSFAARSCTVGGCSNSVPRVLVTTLSSVPELQGPPNVTALSSTELFVTWSPPDLPNGIIIFYELWMRGLLKGDGTRNPPQTRIFHPSGQYNPRPVTTPQENALSPPATNYTVRDLEPYTVYEFLVMSENDAGKTSSAWTPGRTGEAAPLSTPAPFVVGLSSTSVNVSWPAPSDSASRGGVVSYRLYQYRRTNVTVDPFAPPRTWQLVQELSGTTLFYVVTSLTPYAEQQFMVGACNSMGCVNSSSSVGRTLPGVPALLQKPLVDGVNSTVMGIVWQAPLFPNGPDPSYTVEKTTIALSNPARVSKGTRFPGGGYYLFPAETLTQNVAFTGIRLWFRLTNDDGLIFYSGSSSQDEYVALQFEFGRPRFYFDTQGCIAEVSSANVSRNDGEWHYITVRREGAMGNLSVDGQLEGCSIPASVTTTDDEGLRYNDGIWHFLQVFRNGISGEMGIDHKYRGVNMIRDASCENTSIIGPTTGLYIGGLPADFAFRREKGMRVSRQGFQGCIRDLEILTQQHPVEVWTRLDWTTSIRNELAFLNWEGCPLNLDKGVHFMGNGYAELTMDSRQILRGDDIEISLQFRTAMPDGLLFMAHGGTNIYLFAAVMNNALRFQFSNGTHTGGHTYAGIRSFCDGLWRTINFRKTGMQANVTVDGATEVQGLSSVFMDVPTYSSLFVAGIPPNSEVDRYLDRNNLTILNKAFGGCIANLIVTGRLVNFGSVATNVANINMDGCPPFSTVSQPCAEKLLNKIYEGNNTVHYDAGLQPYTDYIYRVTATNTAGTTFSPWGYGRTREGAPVGVKPPLNVVPLSGYSLEVQWTEPQSTSGLLTKYSVRAYVFNQTDPVTAEFTDTSATNGTLTGTIPYTDYFVKLAACTSGGCTESADGFPIKTLQEAPENVSPPFSADTTPTSLTVAWREPQKPNGEITGYFLYQNGAEIYAGGETSRTIRDLQVYTAYQFYVRACTVKGCTASTPVALSTAQLPPTGVVAPTLQSLGTKRVEVTWRQPDRVNGALERYVLYLSGDAASRGQVVYNSSDLFTSYTLTNLTAGTQYFVTLAACTGGGCTLSNTSNVTTAESAPEGVPAPQVASPSPSQLHVTWGEPAFPNGAILRYELTHNGRLAYTGMGKNYSVDGLEPYSLNLLRLSACTSQGCGSSDQVEARTQESPPSGIVVMDLVVVDSRTVNVTWQAPLRPNGMLYYGVYFDGLFYSDPANWNYSTVRARRSLLRETFAFRAVSIGSLVPLSQYNVQVNASNTQGFILSNMVGAQMPAGTPDGMAPPRLVSETPTSITVLWQPVGRINAVEDVRYVLQFREKQSGALIQDIFGPTSTLSYTKRNLLPFTQYEFRVVVSNSLGSTYSEWVTQTTRQDKPTGLRPPQVANVQAHYVDLAWEQPLNPNGVIMEFRVIQNDQLRETVPGNQTTLQAEGLTPFSSYVFSVEACTVAGCTSSGNSAQIRTLEAVPSGLGPPLLVSLTPSSVEVRWSDPSSPNGDVASFELERRQGNSSDIIPVAVLSATGGRIYLDESPMLSPYTQYQYRVSARNTAGLGEGPWATVTTRASRPAGVTAPSVTVLGPRSLSVAWQPPYQPNGLLEFYILRLPEPRIELRNISAQQYTVSGLLPFTNYSVTVTACTAGGCTESTAVRARTQSAAPEGQGPPTPTAVSESMVSVLWQPPTFVNGPNLFYELARRKVRQPLDPTASGFDQWERVYTGASTFYEDRGLSMFTTFVYRVTTFNDVGQTSSNASMEATTFGGLPRTAPNVTLTPKDHLSILVEWIRPSPQELQGEVARQYVNASSPMRNLSVEAGPSANSSLLPNLTPNTQYTITVTMVIYGGASVTSSPKTARTLDGAPQGLEPPILSIISDTVLRAAWRAPSTPNGEILAYNIMVNDRRVATNMTTPGSVVLDGLQPFTVYAIKLEVCTVFDCSQSEARLATTAEAAPQGQTPPSLQPLSPRSVAISWQPPSRPNGIVLQYQVQRKTLVNCSEQTTPDVDPEQSKCTYVECTVVQNICGSTCYSGSKVCCDGVLHNVMPGYACCGQRYLPRPSVDAVCCAGQFFSPNPGFQCCGARYVFVGVNQTCCADPNEDRVTVGYGNACCGSVPYDGRGPQICCRDILYDGYGQTCCGGEMVPNSAVCCGNATSGQVYLAQLGRQCCGDSYVDTSLSLCCVSDTGHAKVHYYPSNDSLVAANEKCCGLEKISAGLSCCNYAGYNPSTQVCADISNQQPGCGTGKVCLASQRGTAFCNRCDFSHNTHICASVPGYIPPPSTSTTPAPGSKCTTAVESVFTGNQLSYTDSGLRPHTSYEYLVTVTNSAGSDNSNYSSVTTLSDAPEGVQPPSTRVNPQQLYIIYLTWKKPDYPNGDILRYVLTRDGVELYRGLGTSYTDDTSILPYNSYSYRLTACTEAGCTASPRVTVATAEAPPEGLSLPSMEILGPTSLKITWQAPSTPNGVISLYRLQVFPQNRTFERLSPGVVIIADLTPFTEYSVSLEVCTRAGCTSTNNVSAITAQSAPQGVSKPRIVILSSTEILLFWRPPTTLNGQVTGYRILRTDGVIEAVVYSGLNETTSDRGLTPGVSYTYRLEASTSGGVGRSGPVMAVMPLRTPDSMPPPNNVTAVSPTEIFIAWSAVSVQGDTVDQYRVVLNAGLETEIEKGVQLSLSTTVGGLVPYTLYSVRLQACLQSVNNGCGTSSAVTVRTLEAPPQGMAAPSLKSRASDAVEVAWQPPSNPNGLILNYRVFQRSNNSAEILVNQVSGDTRSFLHAGVGLQPSTFYQYRVLVRNSAGETTSPWADVTTLESVPGPLGAPFLQASGPHALLATWTPPSQPNGRLSNYRVEYRGVFSDPTLQISPMYVTLPGNATATSISGLSPATQYDVRVTVFNKAGNSSSSWSRATTAEGAPSQLPEFTVEKVSTGESVILRWDAPRQANGQLTNYAVYEEGATTAAYQGLNREFEYRRLQPYTLYSVALEACTRGGCTRGPLQSFRTAEVAPKAQAAPTTGTVTSNQVQLKWVAPLSANGAMTSYEVYRRTNLPSTRRRRALSEPKLVFRTLDTSKPEFEYVDKDVQPHTEYQYMVRASNGQGYTDSPWQTVVTSQAPPEGVAPPVVSHVEGEVNTLHVTWQTPAKANGVLQSYSIQRNNSVPFSFSIGQPLEFLDRGLQAYTLYSYTLSVCSGGGCTTSVPTTVRTKEAAPLQVSLPSVTAINSTALLVSWTPPQITNGQLSQYQLLMRGAKVYEGLENQTTVGGLVPYMEYSFALRACTAGGCTLSGEVTGRPDDAVPVGMREPVLRVMSATSVEVSWLPPLQPNGVITSYDVRRDGRLIYTESLAATGQLRQSYTDYNLSPGAQYSYTVIARNRRGSTESPQALARTYASSPTGLLPPSLTPLSSTALSATWLPPTQPNGDIVNYTLYEGSNMVYSGGPDQRTHTISGLQFWTTYSIRVQACTSKGCELSVPATERTMEARPEQQAPPTLVALANQDGAHSGVYGSWEDPGRPNGVITSYQVQRRLVTSAPGGVTYGESILVYNGSAREFTDTDSRLRPYTEYQYLVTAGNKAGKVSSTWAQVRTREAPPEAVLPLKVQSSTATTITVLITPPEIPNGVIQYYNILVNGTMSSSHTGLQHTVGGALALRPATTYALTVRACTGGGCRDSDAMLATTQPALPTGLAPLKVTASSNTTASLAWQPPASPNGVIQRYLVYKRTACPPPSQPFPQTCLPGDASLLYQGLAMSTTATGLQPYSAYEFQLQSENSEGRSNFPEWVPTETQASAPEFVKLPQLFKNGSLAIIVWTDSFKLNGRLRQYILFADGMVVRRDIATTGAVERQLKDRVIQFFIQVVTDYGEAESPIILFDPNAANNIGTTQGPVGTTAALTAGPLWYQEIWFIVLMCILGLVLLFLLLLICIKLCAARRPYIRERVPLHSQQPIKASKPSFYVDPSDGSIIETELPPATGNGHLASIRYPNTQMSATRFPNHNNHNGLDSGMINPAYTSSLHTLTLDKISEVSKLEDEEDDDSLWEKHFDSGLVSMQFEDEDEDDDSFTSPAFSYTREQTVFSDTHL